jgi:hypothetical protein
VFEPDRLLPDCEIEGEGQLESGGYGNWKCEEGKHLQQVCGGAGGQSEDRAHNRCSDCCPSGARAKDGGRDLRPVLAHAPARRSHGRRGFGPVWVEGQELCSN